MLYSKRNDLIYKEDIMKFLKIATKKKLLLLAMMAAVVTGALFTGSSSTEAKAKKVQYLGKYKLTAYCGCRKCSGGYGNKTATGRRAKQGRTIAVDKRKIKLGSKVKIKGKTYVAEDVGGGVKGKHIDVYFKSHKKVKQFGRKNNVKVYKIKK